MSNNYKIIHNMLTLIFFEYIIENIVYKHDSDLCINNYAAGCETVMVMLTSHCVQVTIMPDVFFNVCVSE